MLLCSCAPDAAIEHHEWCTGMREVRSHTAPRVGPPTDLTLWRGQAWRFSDSSSTTPVPLCAARHDTAAAGHPAHQDPTGRLEAVAAGASRGGESAPIATRGRHNCADLSRARRGMAVS